MTATTGGRRSLTYLVVGPFAIVLAFPFYFALVTMFKTNLDLSIVEHSPYVYNDTEGNFHWDFWNYATTEHVKFLFEDTNYRVAAEHARSSVRRSSRSRSCSRCPRGMRLRGSPVGGVRAPASGSSSSTSSRRHCSSCRSRGSSRTST